MGPDYVARNDGMPLLVGRYPSCQEIAPPRPACPRTDSPPAADRGHRPADRRAGLFAAQIDGGRERNNGSRGMNGGHRGRITLTIIPQSQQEDDLSWRHF